MESVTDVKNGLFPSVSDHSDDASCTAMLVCYWPKLTSM